MVRKPPHVMAGVPSVGSGCARGRGAWLAVGARHGRSAPNPIRWSFVAATGAPWGVSGRCGATPGPPMPTACGMAETRSILE